ncbi:hypothetical protein V6N13_062250 [Hibiscus sabdariffa]
MEKMMNDGISDSNNTQLLRDIEEISRALYLQKPSSNALITHIQCLPAYFNDSSLCVHWKGKGWSIVPLVHKVRGRAFCNLLRPSLALQGMIWERIGLISRGCYRLLWRDLVGEKSAGKWTTSFELSGEAKGATLNVSFSFLDVGVDECIQEKSVCSERMSLAELESDFHDLLIRESSVSESLSALDEFIDNEKFMEMLEIEHGPFNLNSDDTLDSPRERLLREFEIEALASGRSRGKESLSLANRRPVKMLEYIETEALMREWGLDEKAFQSSPCVRTDGFGSPIELSPERVELPPLGEGFGHFIPTKDEGVLRSMNPSQFINCKNVGHLAMQVSRAAVFPARLGIDVMEILQNLASLGLRIYPCS